MGALSGTAKDPTLFKDKVSRAKAYADQSQAQVAEMERRLSDWEAFSGTRHGQVVIELATPYIQYFERQLKRSVTDIVHSLPSVSAEHVREMRAEWRGAIGVWETILYERDRLSRELEELRKAERGEAREPSLPPQVEKYA